jgi:hypothetical protein
MQTGKQALKCLHRARLGMTRLGIITIALWGNWQPAIAQAQAVNTVVYVLGNNPATLSVARQVVTNPVIGTVNGQTAIVTGVFDPPTANRVTLELQRRGIAAQQTVQTFLTNASIGQSSSSTVTLPSYFPNSLNNLDNPSRYRYVTAVPMSGGGMTTLLQVQRYIPSAFVARSFRGDYIYAGGYTNRDGAESLRHFLRAQGINARVLYF